MLPELPTEIVENVIDEATYDTRTLRNFALTCRDLLPRARLHLFRFIRLKGMIQLRSFYKLLDHKPHLASFVISLTLSTTRGDPKSLSLLHIAPTPLFRKLPNLCIWEIADPDADRREPRKWLSFAPGGPILRNLIVHGTGIVKLYLDSVSLRNCAHFVDYVLAFQSLEYLYCRSLRFETGLDDLRFELVKQRLAGRLQLSTLIIGRDVPNDATRALLESSPSTLVDLELCVEPGETELDVPSLVSKLRELHSLTLAVQLCKKKAEPKNEFCDPEETVLGTEKIIEALSLHPKSRLQNLILRICEVDLSQLLDLYERNSWSESHFKHYADLESILLRLPKSCNIEVHHNVTQDIDWTFVLEDRLPKLFTQGRVTFKRLPSSHPRRTSHDAGVSALAASPDSKWIASGSGDCTIILWDTEHHSVAYDWIAHPGAVQSVAFSPDSRRLASAGNGGEVVVWDISGSRVKQVAILEGRVGWVNFCAWSPDGTTLVSAAGDRTIRIWDTRTYEQLRLLQNLPAIFVWSVQFSPNGRWIASLGIVDDHDIGAVGAVWDATTGDLHMVFNRHSTAAFDPTTKRIVAASFSGIQIWDIEARELLVELEEESGCASDVAFSPDGRCVASVWHDRTVKVWDSFSGGILLSLQGPFEEYSGSGSHYWRGVVCFSPDGKYIAALASAHGIVQLWRASDGACIRTLDVKDGGYYYRHYMDHRSLVYSPDGETLVFGGPHPNKQVHIWHLRDVIPEEYSSEVDRSMERMSVIP